MKKQLLTVLVCWLIGGIADTFAQFTLDGQILQRSEYRNGFGGLIRENQDPALFTAHRARLQALYEMEDFTFYMSIQDVRTWGSTPQIKTTDNFLSVHEAWAQMKVGEHWFIKLGRQELNYDNFRFLGNLDWALQARAHDFALAKYEKGAMKFHFGGAYNQAAQSLTEQPFLIPNQYKVAQMARYENKWGKTSFSALFWNDGREWQRLDDNGATLNKGVRYRSTLGIPTLKYNSGNSQLAAFYYHQFGKDINGRSLNAYNFSLAYNQVIPVDKESGKQWTLSIGTEYISGTSNLGDRVNRSYNPLYGTNHLFNGYMDLFFVGGTHENSVGVEDYFIRSRYAFGPKFFLQGDYHLFYAQSDVFDLRSSQPTLLNSYFGSEVDLTLGCIVSNAFSIQAGYSQFFHTDTYAYLKNIGDAKSAQNWAYLMLVFRPTMKNKFIGVLL